MQAIGRVLEDRWFQRVIGVGSLLFVTWFVISEVDGLIAFGRYLVEVVEAVPRSLTTIAEYYQQIDLGQLWPSLMIGAIVGILTTTVVAVTARAGVSLPRPSIRVLAIALAVSVIAYYVFGLIFLNAVLAGLMSLLLAGYALQPDMRMFFSRLTLARATQPDIRPFVLRAIMYGALGGALGSQVLAYPIQHCTFGDEVPLAQRQLGVLTVAMGSLFVLLPVWTLMLWRRRGAVSQQGTAGYFRGLTFPLLLLLPTLVVLVVFLYYPATEIVSLSLKLRRAPLPQERFVCLENYTNLFQDTIYRSSFTTTILITIAIVVFTMSIALAISLLASQKVRGASVYRTLLIYPYALSPVVTGVIFFTMFQQESGLVNFALQETLGIRYRWLTDPQYAPWVIVIASVWNALGFNILFYIAGLQNIPKDLLEAAEIDGANRPQRFFRITFPLLSPFTFFLLVTNVTYSFYGIYGVVDTLTGGGPPLGPGGRDGGATNVLIYKLYQDAFSPGAPAGLAAAQALILFLMVASVTLIQFRYLERRVNYAE